MTRTTKPATAEERSKIRSPRKSFLRRLLDDSAERERLAEIVEQLQEALVQAGEDRARSMATLMEVEHVIKRGRRSAAEAADNEGGGA